MKKQIKDITAWDDKDWLTANCDWILPQVVARIGELPLVKNGGMISFRSTLEAWGKSGLDLGDRVLELESFKRVLVWINQAPRGQVLGSGKVQTRVDWIHWSAPVPLVLSAFKRYRSVGYELWDWTDSYCKYFLDPDLAECVPYFHKPPVFEADQLLEWRARALEVKTGKNMGTTRKPQSTAVAYNITDPDFKDLPRLLKLMLLQLWCYMPQFYNPYMIVNLQNLDQPQVPLVDDNILPIESKHQLPTLDEIWK